MNDLTSAASPELIEEMLDIVAREAMIERTKLALDTRLKELDIQSADFVMILMAVEEKFGTYISVDSEFSDVETVGDLVRIVSAKIEKAGKGASA
jgi:acyl carrier protein